MSKSLGCQLAIGLLVLVSTIRAQDSDEPVFSGPQIGEKMVHFKAEGVLGDLAGKEFDLIEQAEGGPVAIVFLHELTRPSAAVTRAVMDYAGKFSNEGLVCGVVFLSDDATATAAQIKRASHALPKVAIGISPDGGEGPGAYGLNRKMTLTILIGNGGKVTANFPLIQPSIQADAPKIGREIARVVGKDVTPTLAQMGVKTRYVGKESENNRRDPKLGPLLRAVIQKTATMEQVVKAASAVEDYVAAKSEAKLQVGEIANRIVTSGKLNNYGTAKAQEYLKKWATEFVAKRPTPPKRNGEARVDKKRAQITPTYLQVTKGIVGGFVPAHVREQLIVTRSGDQYKMVVMQQPSRSDEATYRHGALTKMQWAGLVKELSEKGLWKLPIESPSGCDDIYQLDTSIAIRAGTKFWRNSTLR